MSHCGLLLLALVSAASTVQCNDTLQQWTRQGLAVEGTNQRFKAIKFELVPGKKGTQIEGKDAKGTIMLIMKANGAAGTIISRPIKNIISNPAPVGGRKMLQSCSILTLDLQGLKIDLLGLNIDLSPVLLDVFATPTGLVGALLEGLLCDLARLVQIAAALSDIVAVLNQIVAAIA